VPKLLLADDSPTTQKVVQLTFADEGIEVVVADDGDLAMELYDHHHPDIVLADINIPGLNGYEVCETIRKRPSNGSTPVVLLAGSFEPFDVEEAHRVGANDYLTKPFSSIRRLVATVTALLDTVTREDASVEETIEPNSVPPQSVVHESLAVGHAEPGPAAAQAEPDMLTTHDIENLYNQSLVETAEMPHSLVEQAMQGAGDAEEKAAARIDDGAFDDELIETTHAFSESENAAAPDVEIQQSGSIEDTSPLEEPNASANTELSQDVESAIPLSTGRYEAAVPDIAEISEAEGVEELQIDQSGDEAYFEPTTETQEPALETSEPTPSNDRPEYQAKEQALAADAIAPEPEDEPVIQTVDDIEPSAFESNEPETIASADSFDERSVEALETAVDIPREQTPWDTLAAPKPVGFHLEGLDLLELPTDMNGRPSAGQPLESDAMPVSQQVAEMTPEIVDQIAKATASQISEELVREIAQRIVPRVIEEVIAKQGGGTPDH
jgi:CheY-like chemotaxis protein